MLGVRVGQMETMPDHVHVFVVARQVINPSLFSGRAALERETRLPGAIDSIAITIKNSRGSFFLTG